MTGLEFYNRVYGLIYFRENFILFVLYPIKVFFFPKVRFVFQISQILLSEKKLPLVTRNLIKNTIVLLPLIMFPYFIVGLAK